MKFVKNAVFVETDMQPSVLDWRDDQTRSRNFDGA